MNNWVAIDKFAKSVKLDIVSIKALIKSGDLKAKKQNNGMIMINAEKTALISSNGKSIINYNGNNKNELSSDFVEKTIGTILSLHEKVVDSKDETLEAIKSENQFLKESFLSMQDLYDEDRRTIEALTKELEHTRDDLELTKRKYKLMWGKAIENSTK